MIFKDSLCWQKKILSKILNIFDVDFVGNLSDSLDHARLLNTTKSYFVGLGFFQYCTISSELLVWRM